MVFIAVAEVANAQAANKAAIIIIISFFCTIIIFCSFSLFLSLSLYVCVNRTLAPVVCNLSICLWMVAVGFVKVRVRTIAQCAREVDRERENKCPTLKCAERAPVPQALPQGVPQVL